VKKLLFRLLVVVLSCLVIFSMWEWYWSWEPVLHNGTNRDDDDARSVMGLAFILGVAAFLTIVWTISQAVRTCQISRRYKNRHRLRSLRR
jgi:hypothetical protein